MPTSRADRTAPRAGLVAALLVLTACSGTPAPNPPTSAPPAGAPSGAPSGGPAPQSPSSWGLPVVTPSPGVSTRGVAKAMARTLTRLSTAISIRDRAGFLAGLDPSDPAFVARQLDSFDAVSRLPEGSVVSGSVLPHSVRVRADGDRADVMTTTQIAGFDVLPVSGRRVLRFVDDPARPGDLLLAGSGGAPAGGLVEPWETQAVTLRRSHGVLGVFDAGSLDSADAVMRSAKAAVAGVATAVPYDWPRTVVVYALTDPTFLAGLRDVPGGDPLALDGVSFPVRGADGRLAATRIALNPRMLHRGPDTTAARDRLLRHEMVHVAVGEHDDRAPLWLSEGIAEYLSARSLAPGDRTLSRAAVRAARAGLTGLPGDDGFAGASHAVSYGVSWWACEAIVARGGELALWSLLDAYAAAPAGTEPDAVLRRVVGLDGPALAARAGRLMIREYG